MFFRPCVSLCSIYPNEERACFRSPDVDVSGSQERRFSTDQVHTDTGRRQAGGAEECRPDASRRGNGIGMSPLWYAYVSRSPRVN